MEAFKNAVPLCAWDVQSKLWWVPDIYSHVAEIIAIEHGALTDDQLLDVRRVRTTSYAKPEKDLKTALTELGLSGSADLPLALVQRAWAYWESSLNMIPTAAAALEKKRIAYEFVLKDYEQHGTLMDVLGGEAP